MLTEKLDPPRVVNDRAGTPFAVTIVPGVLATFVVGAPSSATAGTPFPVTVTAKDAFGNVSTNYTGPAYLVSSDSQQVTPFFLSLTNGVGTASVTLTRTGSHMLPDVQAGLDMLVRAIDIQTSVHNERSLGISVAPSFASKWLVPKLSTFYEQYPDIDLRISATVGLADFKRDDVDIAIGWVTANIRDCLPSRCLRKR